MKKTMVFVAFALSVVYVACKKEHSTTNTTPTSVSTKNTKHVIAKRGDCDPSNSSNPYDNIGYMHNQMENAILSASLNNPTFNDMLSICSNYLSANNLPAWNPNQCASVPTNYDYSLINNISSINARGTYEANLISNSSLSNTAKGYLTTLLSSVFNPSNYTSTSTYCDLKSNIMSFEATISADNNLSVSEKQLLLSACSIGRYSSYLQWNSDPNKSLPEFMTIGGMIADMVAFVSDQLGDSCNNPTQSAVYATIMSTIFEYYNG